MTRMAPGRTSTHPVPTCTCCTHPASTPRQSHPAGGSGRCLCSLPPQQAATHVAAQSLSGTRPLSPAWCRAVQHHYFRDQKLVLSKVNPCTTSFRCNHGSTRARAWDQVRTPQRHTWSDRSNRCALAPRGLACPHVRAGQICPFRMSMRSHCSSKSTKRFLQPRTERLVYLGASQSVEAETNLPWSQDQAAHGSLCHKKMPRCFSK
mmetsp:Transcript_7489/g.20775  ORF Transcript_7489/g.20775 Transcript_7489/m.20775 type:complete len:206 (-) Transcript_7489:784-1401(-)